MKRKRNGFISTSFDASIVSKRDAILVVRLRGEDEERDAVARAIKEFVPAVGERISIRCGTPTEWEQQPAHILAIDEDGALLTLDIGRPFFEPLLVRHVTLLKLEIPGQKRKAA